MSLEGRKNFKEELEEDKNHFMGVDSRQYNKLTQEHELYRETLKEVLAKEYHD